MWFKGILRRRREAAVAPLFDEAFLRRLERLSLQAQRTLRGTPAGGEHPSRHRLPTTIFSEHRPYSVGDDYRYVDWNAYAHQDQIFVKLGEAEQDVNVHVLLDISRSMAWGEPPKLRAAQQLVAALGYLALAHNDRLRVVPFDSTPLRPFGPAQGKSTLIELFRFVEGLQTGGPTAPARVLNSYAAHHGRGGLLVLLSDLLAPEGLEAGLRAVPPPRWQVLVLHLLDPHELRPNMHGPLELEDAETGQRLPLTLDPATLAGYQRNVTAWQERIAETCARRGASYAQVLTSWPLERAVIPYLRTRRILQSLRHYKPMTFLQPLLLLALLTLPVILVLHLLRERRRRVAVPSLLHWLNLPHRREGERIRRLPLTLLLLLHLLIAGLLGLAVGRPQVFGAPSSASRQTIIVLDISTSMAAREGSTTRFAQAQGRARALLRGMGANDRATLIAAGHTAHIVAAGGASELALLTAALDALRPGSTGADLAGALTLAEGAFDPQREDRIVVISDGALPTFPSRTLAAPLDWQQVGGDQPNRAIITFATRPWGDKLQVYARAANYDSAAFATRLRLYGDERLIDTRDVSIAVDGETELTWTLPASYTALRAELDGRDGLPQDDQAFLPTRSMRTIKALLVSARPESLRRALGAVPGVGVTVVEPAKYASGSAPQDSVDLTIFDSFLPQAWPVGAVLAINPPPGSSTLLEVGTLPIRPPVGELSQSSALLEGINLGGVNFGSVQPVTPPAWATTQLAINDTPLILRGRDGANEIAIWTFNLASGNLPTRLAFPLLVARTVRDLVPLSIAPEVQVGAPLTVRPDPRTTTIQLTAPDGTRSVVPTAPLLTLDTLTQPGFYRVEERSGGAPLFVGQVGVNAGAASESNLRPRTVPQLAGPPQQFSGAPQRQVIDLWPWLALGALALLMLEWGYIHR